jgi:peptidoglycan/LPS O-acetylase OafA/YrhL
MKTGRIEEFESLRGLMALWVLLGHVTLTFTPPSSLDGSVWRLCGANTKAVDVFIVISGFVVFHLLSRGRESYRRYIARRFLRLFPAYWVCLVISLAMLPVAFAANVALHPVTARTLERISILQAGLANFWPHVLAHLTMLHGAVPWRMLPATDYAFLGQAWSISVEWQFYLVAPLLLWLATMRPRWIGLGLLAVLCAGVFHARFSFGDGFIGSHIGYFALGCMSFFFWQADRRRLGAVVRHATLAIPAVCVAWILLFPREWHVAIWIAVLLSCVSVRLPNPGHLPCAVSAVLRMSVLRWLGRISYSLYLSHMIGLNATLWLLRDAGLAPVAMILTTLVGTLLSTLLMADLLQRWVEAPFISFGRHLPERWFPSHHDSLETGVGPLGLRMISASEPLASIGKSQPKSLPGSL